MLRRWSRSVGKSRYFIYALPKAKDRRSSKCGLCASRIKRSAIATALVAKCSGFVSAPQASTFSSRVANERTGAVEADRAVSGRVLTRQLIDSRTFLRLDAHAERTEAERSQVRPQVTSHSARYAGCDGRRRRLPRRAWPARRPPGRRCASCARRGPSLTDRRPPAARG